MPPRVLITPLRTSTTASEVARLFHPLVVEHVMLDRDHGPVRAILTFSTERDADMACLRDHTVLHGSALHVTRLFDDAAAAPPASSDQEPLKNLYVLNLPLDVDHDQLRALFRPFGTVRHCVILSMLDGQARRRGFVDMDTAEEAQRALAQLDGQSWRGYTVELSYARVQRSDAKNGCARMEPCKLVDIHGLLPAATIDQDDVRALVAPLAGVVDVAYPLGQKRSDTQAARITLADANDAPAVWASLNGADVRGQHLLVTPASNDA